MKTPLDSLDPVGSVDLSSGRILAILFHRLYRSGEGGKLIPELVIKENLNENKVVLTLRAGLSFQDGGALRAQDAAYCLNRLIDSGRQAWITQAMDSVKAISENRLEITLKEKKNAAAQWERQRTLLSLPQTAIYSEKSHRENGSFVSSTGLDVSENNREKVVLRSSRKGSENREIHFLVLPEDSARWFYFQKEILDFYEASGVFRYLTSPGESPGDSPEKLAADTVKPAHGNELYQKQIREELTVLYGAIVSGKDEIGPLADPEFRRALNYRLDRKALAGKVLLDAYSPADHPVPLTLMAAYGGAEKLGTHFDFRPAFAYQPEKSKPAKPIVIYSPSDRERQLTARVLRSVIEELGYEASIRILDLPTLIRFNNARYEGIYLLKWVADYPHAENFLLPLFHSRNRGAGGNRAWYSNGQVDSLLERTTIDPATVIAAQRIIREDAPWIFIGFSKREFFTKTQKRIPVPVIYTGWSVESFFP